MLYALYVESNRKLTEMEIHNSMRRAIQKHEKC